MANRVQFVQFKSQKDINKERQEKLAQRKADIRRRVGAIKNNPNQHSEKEEVKL